MTARARAATVRECEHRASVRSVLGPEPAATRESVPAVFAHDRIDVRCGAVPRYTEGILALQILILAVIPFSISSILSAKLQANESKRIGISAIVRIGTLLVLISILGQYYGLIGLSISVVLSMIADTFFLYLLYKKQFN